MVESRNTLQYKEKWMQKALKLAAKARGCTSPNPMVGAVLVKDGKIVGKGYHKKAGTPHAEIHAIREAGDMAEGSTLYVTLEPCCHWGRTPPCTKAIIESKISSVIVAMFDPNSYVSGKGIKELKEHGINVDIGILEAEAIKLNEAYIKFIKIGFPFVTIKTAMSLDGKIATTSGDSKWISSEESRRKVHEIRDSVDGICVGINTVLRDNPRLTTRLPDRKGKDPARIVLDSKARIPLDARILHLQSSAPTIIATTDNAPKEKLQQLESIGAKVIITPACNTRVNLPFLMKKLAEKDMVSILIEGGGEVNASALNSGIVDKMLFFIAPKLIGGNIAPGPVGGKGINNIKDSINLGSIEISKIGNDILVEGYIAYPGKNI